MDVEQSLTEFGLTPNEVKVYLLLLKTGDVKLQELARRVELPRTTVFNTLNYLIAKGLASKITKERIARYFANEPSKLREKALLRVQKIEEAIPELMAMQRTFQASANVEVYEGAQGAYAIYMDVFKDKEMKYMFGNYYGIRTTLSHLMVSARNIRLDRKIPAKVLLEPCDDEIFHTPKYKRISEMRQTPSLKKFPGYLFIYGSNVAMFTSQREIVGVIIRNPEVAQMMKMMFEHYWKDAKPIKL